MNSSTEDIVMKHVLTPAKQNAMLSTCEWVGDSKVRVVCTHRTEPLLRAAGLHSVRPMESYVVPVLRDKSGFLVLDHERRAAADCPGELFEPGGLLQGLNLHAGGEVEVHPAPEDFAGFFQETKAGIRARRFEVSTGPSSKVRVLIVALDDKALPSPGERELWEAREPSDTDIYAATHALALARNLKHHER